MEWKESFIEQMMECERTGNMFVVEDPRVGKGVVVCVLYKTYCQSVNCRDKRVPYVSDA